MSKEVKVVLCGGSSTGKSGLIMRLITDQFMATYDPTIEDKYIKVLSVDNEPILLDILDTAGQEQFSSMQQFWFREGEIFLIVYDITSSHSFSDVKHFIRKIADAQGFDITKQAQTTYAKATADQELKPFIIVGNKCDLEDKRQVSTESGQQLSDRYGVPFFECSCLTEHNLDNIWSESVRLHRKIVTQAASSKPKPQSKTDAVTEPTAKKTCCGLFASEPKGHATDNIQFFTVQKALPDKINVPVLSLKNFRIARTFNKKRFAIAIVCGLFLPVVILFQTIAFLLYNENKEPWFYPEYHDYETIHSQILLDFLGLMVGRAPRQDPDAVRNRQWFLRQSTTQKIARVILCLLIAFTFTVLYYNVSQVDNVNLSRQETMGPLVLFLILWLLISSWIAWQPKITPPLPPLVTCRLRSIELIFGEYFTHRTDVYKFLRAYAAARQENNVLSVKQYLSVMALAALYALIPGITRATVGDQSDEIEHQVFWTKQNRNIEVGAFIVNFFLVGIFILGLEVQYSKHFDTYKDWMTDMTLLLSKEQLNAHREDYRGRAKTAHGRNREEMIEMKENLTPHKFGRDFSKHLFLSLVRRSNALGWLEIRSFLAIEGKQLFGEQELPTLFLMIGTLYLSFFVLYRVYFVEGNAEQSILFNGSVVLMLICLVSLIRIAITGYRFQNLQKQQERLLGEQKLWMRTHVAESIGVETMDVKLAAFGVRSLSQMERKLEEEHKENKEEEEEDAIQINFKGGNLVDSDNDDESKPLMEDRNEADIDVLQRVDTTNWYTYNFGFIDDILFIVRKKDIYPRLFNVKLNSVLAKAIAGVFFSSFITFFKVFVQ